MQSVVAPVIYFGTRSLPYFYFQHQACLLVFPYYFFLIVRCGAGDEVYERFFLNFILFPFQVQNLEPCLIS